MTPKDTNFGFTVERVLKINARPHDRSKTFLDRVSIVSDNGTVSKPALEDFTPTADGHFAAIVICSRCESTADFFKTASTTKIHVSIQGKHFEEMCKLLMLATDLRASEMPEVLISGHLTRTEIQILRGHQQQHRAEPNVGVANHLPHNIPPAHDENFQRLYEELRKELTCKVCYISVINTVLLPCGHECLCLGCCDLLTSSGDLSCPVCRTRVTEHRQVFRG